MTPSSSFLADVPVSFSSKGNNESMVHVQTTAPLILSSITDHPTSFSSQSHESSNVSAQAVTTLNMILRDIRQCSSSSSGNKDSVVHVQTAAPLILSSITDHLTSFSSPSYESSNENAQAVMTLNMILRAIRQCSSSSRGNKDSVVHVPASAKLTLSLLTDQPISSYVERNEGLWALTPANAKMIISVFEAFLGQALGQTSHNPEQPCQLYTLIALQQNFPLPGGYYPTENWLSTLCLTSYHLDELMLSNLNDQQISSIKGSMTLRLEVAALSSASIPNLPTISSSLGINGTEVQSSAVAMLTSSSCQLDQSTLSFSRIPAWAPQNENYDAELMRSRIEEYLIRGFLLVSRKVFSSDP